MALDLRDVIEREQQKKIPKITSRRRSRERALPSVSIARADARVARVLDKCANDLNRLMGYVFDKHSVDALVRLLVDAFSTSSYTIGYNFVYNEVSKLAGKILEFKDVYFLLQFISRNMEAARANIPVTYHRPVIDQPTLFRVSTIECLENSDSGRKYKLKFVCMWGPGLGYTFTKTLSTAVNRRFINVLYKAAGLCTPTRRPRSIEALNNCLIWIISGIYPADEGEMPFFFSAVGNNYTLRNNKEQIKKYTIKRSGNG